MLQGLHYYRNSAQPAQIIVVFSCLVGDIKAHLQLSAGNDAALAITVMHEESTAGKLLAYGLDGDGRMQVEVRDHESLTIIVRHESDIVACGVFEVDLALIDCIGVILAPRATSNLIVDQCEGQVIQRGLTSALAVLDATLSNEAEVYN